MRFLSLELRRKSGAANVANKTKERSLVGLIASTATKKLSNFNAAETLAAGLDVALFPAYSATSAAKGWGTLAPGNGNFPELGLQPFAALLRNLLG